MVNASALIAPRTNRTMHAALQTIATLPIRDCPLRSRHDGGLR
jgi:hypothetical protein